MPTYEFTITAPATISARVKIEADSLESAHEIALSPDFYENLCDHPESGKFELDDGNTIDEVYLPDPSDFEVSEEPAAPKPR